MTLQTGDSDSSDGTVTPTVIDARAVTTKSLKALQSDDQRKVMDIVDKLRRTGLSGIVGLPQIGKAPQSFGGPRLHSLGDED